MSYAPSSSKNAGRTVKLIGGIFLLLLLAFASKLVLAIPTGNTSDLAVTKSASVSQPLPDQTVTFSVQIFNSGVISATNGTLIDNLDSNLTFVGPVSIAGGGDSATTGTPPVLVSGLTISPSTAVTITFPVRVNSALPGGTVIKNTAVAESSEFTAASSNEVLLTVTTPTAISWKQRSAGIDGGRVNVIAVDPHNPARLFAGTPAGLFKSDDKGDSWTAIGANLQNNQVFALAMDPLHSGVLYAGTQQGLFKSNNGGNSWAATNAGLTGSIISGLAIDPGQPSILYAGTDNGVFKSSDGGNSWLSASAGLSEPQVTALAIDPRHSNTLYAGTPSNGVFKSSDGGRSWAPANSGLNNLVVHSVHTDPANKDTLYAGTDAGLFKSKNGGSNWTSAGKELAALVVHYLAIDPAGGQNLYAATENGIARSTNGGGSWSPVSEVETITLAIDHLNPILLYAGTAGEGVFRSDDGGSSWRSSTKGISGGSISVLTIHPADTNFIFAGTPGRGLFRSVDSGRLWQATNDGLADRNIRALAIPSGIGTLLYAGTDSGVFRSSNNGDSWVAVNNGLTNTAIQALSVHPTKNQVLYAGTAGGGIFRSNNGGNSWTKANNGMTDAHVLTLAIDPSDGQIIYAGTKESGLFKSSDSGGNWTAINSGQTITKVQTIAIDPLDSQIVFAGGPGGIFRSSNGGGSWQASSVGLDTAAVQSLAFDPANSSILYAATAENGVFRSTGSGFNWKAVNDGLTAMHLSALALASSNTLYAGTSGGVFSSGPHLDVTKQVDSPHPDQGDNISYTILINNAGTLPISDGTVADDLNGNLKFVGPVTLEGGGTAATTGNPPLIVKNLALEPGETATITLPAQVKTGLDNGTTIPNTAVANAPQLHAPASGQVTTTTYRPNRLVTNQTVDNSAPQPGQIVNYAIEIENRGNNGVGGIEVFNTLDSNLSFVGPVQIIGSNGTAGSPPLIASGLGLDAGRKLTIKFQAKVNDDTLPGTIIDNTAQVTSYPWPVPISSQAGLAVSGPAARDIYVDAAAASGANDGTSWQNAYTNLQDALADAGSGSQIWVAAGTYYPDVGRSLTDDDPAATFHLRPGVAVFGGFVGTENSLQERDPAANETILSGDIDGNDTAACDTSSGVEPIKGSNSIHVVTGSNMADDALLDGFTISGGHARDLAGSQSQHGGGMFIEQGSPTLVNLIFCGNKANGSGGGIFNDAGSPILKEVTFVNNKANLASGQGGGMANVNGSSPLLENVDFTRNLAYYGGGMFNTGSVLNISGAVFKANRATWGGGIFNAAGSSGTFTNISLTTNAAAGGGGMANDNSSPKMVNITWAGNVASQRGGGLSTASGDPQLINTVFSGNLAEAGANGQQSWGAGIYVSGGQPALANATVTGNWARALGTRPGDEGLGGGLFAAGGELTIHNTIFWANEGDRTPDLLVANGAATTIKTSRLDGCPQYSLCENLVNDDPQFVLPMAPTNAPTVDGNLSLRPGSALVDAGDNSLVPADILTDRAGEVRIYNNIVDLGAFELPIACPAANVARLYVNASVADGDNSGLAWKNALSDLSHAFALAEGCQENRIGEIWVAAGKYVPTNGNYAAEGARESTFNLTNGLAVYGGFAGTELVLEERDWLTNLTILSGDITSDDLLDSNGLVTDTMRIVGENSYHVVSSIGNDGTAVLDGFIIIGGQADGEAAVGNDSGGGIYVEASSPTLRHLTVQANTAYDGGGIANISGSNPALQNIRVAANRATFFGGGIFNQSSSPELTNVGLFDNDANSGAGLFNVISSPLLINATIAGNRAGQQLSINQQQTDDSDCQTKAAGCRLQGLGGTAEAAGSGGGMFNLNNSRPLITNSIFWQNEDNNGAGSASATIGNDASSIPLISYSLVQSSGGSGLTWNGSLGFDQGQNIDEDPLFLAPGDRHLLPVSPAVDAGDNEANNSEHDLDMKPRISDGTDDGEVVIDLGVYETTLVGISISHTPNTTIARVGETITFTYVVTNDGAVSLNEIMAIDDILGPVALDATSLEPGESTSGTLSYTLRQGDIGILVTTVAATGKSAAGAVVSALDTVAIEVRPAVYLPLMRTNSE